MKNAFTMIELMIAMAIFGLVIAGAGSIYIQCKKMWHATSLKMQLERERNQAMARLAYGFGAKSGLRAASALALVTNASGWTLSFSNTFDGNQAIQFNQQAGNLYWIDNANQTSKICEHVTAAGITTNMSGIGIQFSLFQRQGRFSASEEAQSFLMMRNRRF